MNKQILLQQLRVIAPLWTIKIERKLRDHTNMKTKCFVKQQRLDLTRYESCIVGEAFLFDDRDKGFSYNNKYRCQKCSSYANWLDRPEPDKYFFKTLEEFIEHFKDKHAERYVNKLEVAIEKKEHAKSLLL